MDEFSSQVVNSPPLFGIRMSVSTRNLLARIAVFHFFMLEGIYDGTWSCYLPGIQTKLAISDSQLGTAALFVYLGITIASPFSAYFLRHIGSKASTYIGSIIFGLSINGIAQTNSFVILMLTLFIYGWTMGIMDVSMNSAGIPAEIVAGRPLLGTFHGSYSAAAAMGSVFGSLLVATKLSIVTVFGALSALSILFSTAASTMMYTQAQEIKIGEINAELKKNSSYDCSSIQEVERGDAKKLSTDKGSSTGGSNNSSNAANNSSNSGRANWLIAAYSAVGFLAAFGESSMITWSVVYFDRVLRVAPGMRGMGFTAFQVSMAAGRFSCDYLRRVIGRKMIVRAGGLLALSGLTLVVMSPSLGSSSSFSEVGKAVLVDSSSTSGDLLPVAGFPAIAFACIGFSVTGFGLSTLIPTSFSSAGHIPGVHPGTAISIASVFTSAGGSISPALIGYLSDGFGSLRTALLCDGLLLGVITLLSLGIPEEDHHRQEPPPPPSPPTSTNTAPSLHSSNSSSNSCIATGSKPSSPSRTVSRMELVLPKPVFDSCDETSLKLKWGNLDTAGLRQLRLQYKDVHLPWEQAKFVTISLDNPSEVNLTAFDVVDLEPGTPYSVRLAVVYQSGEEQFGPETVFDTKPIDCTPKQKKCVIC